MSHEWDRGVLNASSWHGLEEIGQFTDAQSMIAHGETSGAWPVDVKLEALRTESGVDVADVGRAVVGRYQQHPPRALGLVGGRYNATTPANWRSLCQAAVEAGAKPTGAFSLRAGKVVLATFEVNGRGEGIASNFLITDSFDGSLRLMTGLTMVRVVCANTLSSAMHSDGEGMAKLRHTSSLNDQIAILRGEIAQSLKTGESMRDLYRKATDVQLNREQALLVFNELFPEPDENDKDLTKGMRTRLLNNRADAMKAAANPVNLVGRKGNLATLWNAATYLVDREADGSPRKTKGDSDMLDSLLFGQRAKRVSEIQTLVQNIVSTPEVQLSSLLKSLERSPSSINA